MELPRPPQDRRLQQCTGDDQIKPVIESESQSSDENEEMQQSIDQRIQSVVKLQNNQLREELRNFLLLERMRSVQNSQSEQFQQLIPQDLNIMLFGPSGAGKSSLIKTLCLALHNTIKIPEKLQRELKIPVLESQCSTKHFTRVLLKERTKRLLRVSPEEGNTASQVQKVFNTTQINLIDTRGQIVLDTHEVKQLELMLEGRVKNHSLVEQRSYRYAYLLWEFWKRDSELFPADILQYESIENRAHSLIFVFDGSSERVPRSADETHFYREVLAHVRARGYSMPQIVLTRVDKVEQAVQNKYSSMSLAERQSKVREIVDTKLEQVVHALGVPRSSVHFLENYNEVHQNLLAPDETLNFYALRLLKETLKQGEAFVEKFVKDSANNTSKCIIY